MVPFDEISYISKNSISCHCIVEEEFHKVTLEITKMHKGSLSEVWIYSQRKTIPAEGTGGPAPMLPNVALDGGGSIGMM